jgi:HK97 family phage portal protein
MGSLTRFLRGAGERRELTWESVFGTLLEPKSAAGVPVSEGTALKSSAWWRGVSIISRHIGAMPMRVYRATANGREKAEGERAYKLLHDGPNKYMSAAVFRETMMGHVLTWGNAYAEIEIGGDGRPVALWPLLPQDVTVEVSSDGKSLKYRVGSSRLLEYDRVLHVPGLGANGVQGYSVIAHARNSLGLGMAMEEFGSSFFGNGAWPGVAATHPGTLSKPAQDRLKASINREHQGSANAFRVIVLEEGMKLEKIGIPPEDAQFLEGRQFQIKEVARWFNMNPYFLGENPPSSFSPEQLHAELVTDTLIPWMVRWEQECDRKLLRADSGLYCKLSADHLLRADLKTRYEAYAIGRQWGWLSANDVLSREDTNPLDAEVGDVYLQAVNMAEVEKANEPAPDPEDQLAGRAAVAAAYRAMLADTLSRLVRVETDRLRRIKTRAQAEQVSGKLYAEQRARIREALAGPAAAAGRDPAELAGAHVTRSVQELSAALDGPEDGIEERIERLCQRWEATRSVEWADELRPVAL